MAATIYDVAKKAGVSTATVSKVLSNTPYVSAPTRAKVLDAVAELDYVPSLMARGLSKSLTYILVLVIPCLLYTSLCGIGLELEHQHRPSVQPRRPMDRRR